MPRSTDTETEQPIVERDPKPEKSPWTREDELQAEGMANTVGG